MKVRERFGIIRGSPEDDIEVERPQIRYCPSCLESGFREILGPKILMVGEEKPADYDQWLQCLACGRIFPIYESSIESKIQDSTQVIDNPFEQGKSIIGLKNVTKGKTRETDLQKRIKRMKKEIAVEKDPDIKAELKKGNIVKLVGDSFDQ